MKKPPKRFHVGRPLFGPIDPDAIQRLWSRIRIDPQTHCWIMYGWQDEKGYTQIKYRGKGQWSHRLSYVVFCGDIPGGATIDHLCHNPTCVNPRHLRLLGYGENSADANQRTGFRGNQYTNPPQDDGLSCDEQAAQDQCKGCENNPEPPNGLRDAKPMPEGAICEGCGTTFEKPGPCDECTLPEPIGGSEQENRTEEPTPF